MHKLHSFVFNNFKWWFQTELNCRHTDFQSVALPTELWNHIMAVLTGVKPAISSVTERHVNHYTTEPLVAGVGLEPTTSRLWAWRATNCSIPRQFNFNMADDEGFEPPRTFQHLSVFKTDPFNQAWVIIHKKYCNIYYSYNTHYHNLI